MDEAFDAVLELDERTVIRDVRDATLDLRAQRILGADAIPRILVELLHAKRDALRIGIDADDLHLHMLADGQYVAWMIDALPGDVGHMQETVDTAQIDERAVVGNIFDDAVNNLALGKILNKLGALLGAGLFHDGAARHDDIAAATIHFQDLEGLAHMHQGTDVADRADIDLAAGEKRNRTAKIDGETTLDAAEDHAINALVLAVVLLEAGPGFLAARLVARQDRFAHRILDALEIDLDRVAGGDLGVLAGLGKFLERNAPFGLETDIDDDKVVLDGNDLALDHAAFACRIVTVGFGQQGFEVFAGRVKRYGGFRH